MMGKPAEQFLGPRSLPCPLVEIRQGIGAPHVVIHRPLRTLPALGKQPNGILQLPLIG